MSNDVAINLAEPSVTYCGGAREVTGTMHLVSANGRQVLLDCGLHLERKAEATGRNRVFPFDPRRVEAVVLSHAHIDHSGNLPNLVHQGFSGPIYCTTATRDLLALMLADSARIHEEDAKIANFVRRPDAPPIEPLFGQADVQRTLQLCVALPYGQDREILPGIQVRLVDAGHVLGSAMVAMTILNAGRQARLTFTADLGRPNMPLLRDPEPLPLADLVICESTYGGQTHEPIERMAESLRVLVRQTIERGGKVLIPAFSLGRTQIVVHTLQQLRLRGQLPEVPIYVDSPLAGDITEVFRHHPECLSDSGLQQLDGPENFLAGPLLHYIKTVDESKQLNGRRAPCVIIASSGMGEGGRILHHLTHHIDDPRCTVVLVSYQPRDTLGWRLLENRATVRIKGRELNKWADVVSLRGFSSHADHPGIMQTLTPLAGKPTRVRLVHGEIGPAEALAKDLRALGVGDVAIPELGQTEPIANHN
jgi:metallo-beta-lactamase family protein